MQFSSNGVALCIDFEMMRQYQPATPDRKRHVRRLDCPMVLWYWQQDAQHFRQYSDENCALIETAFNKARCLANYIFIFLHSS